MQDHQIIGAFLAVVLVGLVDAWDARKARKARERASYIDVRLVPPLLLAHDQTASSGRESAQAKLTSGPVD